jgi:hypothetical protein
MRAQPTEQRLPTDLSRLYLDLVEVTTGECFKKFNLVGRK